MSYYKEGKIVEINGQYVTIQVLDRQAISYEVTLPVETANLIDIAVRCIGEEVRFDTRDGKISEINPV